MTEKVDAWMPLWIGAYLADTMALNTQQHGAYLLLLIAYWRNGGPLEDDDGDLAGIVRATQAEWKKLRTKMLRFFAIADGKWQHARADRELREAGARRTAAVAKAKQAAEQRWSKAKSNAPSMPGALPEHCPTPSPSPIPSECGSNEPPRAPAKSDGYSSEFEQAWRDYPQRSGHSKAEAFKAWKARLAAGEDVKTMLAGVGRYAAYCQVERTEARFVKHAATFFGPDRHYLNDWTAAPRANTGPVQRQNVQDRRAAWMSEITNPNHGAASDDRVVDAESRFL